MKRRPSVNELKRRLMRAMSRVDADVPDRIARDIRAHACAIAFKGGRRLALIQSDEDLAAG